MATKDAPKQGINASLRKVFVQPFKPQKAKLKPVPSASPSMANGTGDRIEDRVENLPPLQYGLLDSSKKYVRLVEILPGQDFEPIRVELFICDLDQNPAYITLSYMWDQSGQRRCIECQGTKAEIGENLWQFLRQYRSHMATQRHGAEAPPKPVRLWIDRISINQDNLEERSHQVSLMRDIYTSADSVIVWLGMPQGNEELAFLLTRYSHLLKVEDMSIALVNLLNKAYWSRVWVVQEFILPKTVNIWCGELQASVTAIESIWNAESALSNLPALSHRINSSRGYALFTARRDFRHSSKYKREVMGRRNSKTLKATFRLRDLLESFDSSQSSERYDKIYAFLGIASNGRGQKKIRPDYSKSPVALLVEVLQNQCLNVMKRGGDNNFKFLESLRRTLDVSRMELASYLLQQSMDIQPHLYVLAASDFMVVSVSFVSTIMDIGQFVDNSEAFAESTWKTSWAWTRPTMHPRSLSNQDIQDLGALVMQPETSTVFSFADHHVPGGPYPGRSEILRQTVISESAELVIQSLIQPTTERILDNENFIADVVSGNDLRSMFAHSMTYGAKLHLAARPKLTRRDTDHRYERYATFVGTNGIMGLACIADHSGTYEIASGDRICTFAGITDCNNAFIVRLDSNGKWLISGFARILLPKQNTAIASGIAVEEATNDTKKTMCFHCHLTDLLELQRCQILDEVQMERMIVQTLKGDADDEIHICKPGIRRCDTLEFGL